MGYGQKISGQKVLCIPGQKVLGIGQKVFHIYILHMHLYYIHVYKYELHFNYFIDFFP